MLSRTLFLVVVISLLSLTSCSQSPDDTQQAAAVINSVSRFSTDFYSVIAEENKGNLFFSPFCTAMTSAMCWAGARGETAEEFEKALHFSGADEDIHRGFRGIENYIENMEYIELLTSNRAWSSKTFPILKSYRKLLKKYYGSCIETVDFKDTEKTRLEINEAISEDTKGLIPEAIERGFLSPLTVLVLNNSVYFKGNWLNEFKTKSTREFPFYLASGDSVTIPLMYRKCPKDSCMFFEGEGYKLIDIPYKDGETVMTVILPDSADRVREIERLVMSSLDSILAQLEFADKPVHLYLPKFELSWSDTLNRYFHTLGIQTVFSSRADLSGMFGKQGTFLSLAIHKAIIRVDEKGTEAAAINPMLITKSIQPSYSFTTDHPFLFLIRNRESGLILFMGRVMNPLEES